MARYGLFVLNMPLSPNQPTNEIATCWWCADDRRRLSLTLGDIWVTWPYLEWFMKNILAKQKPKLLVVAAATATNYSL